MIRHIQFLFIPLSCICLVLFNAGIAGSVHANQKPAQQVTASKLTGKVIEVIDVPGYTYAHVDTGRVKTWVAGPPTPIKAGDTVSFSSQMPMYNFHSNATGRDFPMIYFISHYETDGKKLTNAQIHGRLKQQTGEPVKNISKVEGGYTIAEIYSNGNKLKGKTVRVRGKVSKFSADIMGRNWLHINDSSTLDDLTITTADKVAVGDIVVIEGKLELDKDFNYGYVYPVIVEGAGITKE